MFRAIVAITLFGLAAAVADRGSTAVQAVADCPDGEPAMKASKVATMNAPALVSTEEGPHLLTKSPAVRLTLRPTRVNPDTPFLVQVFFVDTCNAKQSGKPVKVELGTVSFLPARAGEASEFVVAAPKEGFPAVAPGKVGLEVKIVPANPEKRPDDTAVEVVNAQFVE